MPIRQSGCPDRPRRLPAPEPSEARRDEAAIESRLLVVWISAGILGFQDGTLALDLVNCTVLSWLWFERHGLESVAVPQHSATTGLPALDPPDGGAAAARSRFRVVSGAAGCSRVLGGSDGGLLRVASQPDRCCYRPSIPYPGGPRAGGSVGSRDSRGP